MSWVERVLLRHASRTRTDRGSCPSSRPSRLPLPQDPIRRTCSWAGRGPGRGCSKGILCDARGCWVRRVPCETSHTHTHTHTYTYTYAHKHTHTHTPQRPHTHTHTHVWHEWPLAEMVCKVRKGWEPGMTLQLVAARCALGVSRNRPENSKILYSAVSLSIRASRTFLPP